MNLRQAITLYAQSAGTGSESALPASGRAERQTQAYLYRYQTKLNKTRKRAMPYPGGAFEDKRQILHGGMHRSEKLQLPKRMTFKQAWRYVIRHKLARYDFRGMKYDPGSGRAVLC